MSDETEKPDLPLEARIVCALETLAAVQPVLTAELVELLRGADLLTLQKLFGAALEPETGDRAFGASSNQNDPARLATLAPESREEREERNARADHFRRRPVEGGAGWAA